MSRGSDSASISNLSVLCRGKGDVNNNGAVSITDAQLAYDLATKSWLYSGRSDRGRALIGYAPFGVLHSAYRIYMIFVTFEFAWKKHMCFERTMRNDAS